MKLLKRLKKHFWQDRISFRRLEFDLLLLIFLFVGAAVGSYLTATEVIIPRLFAATSPWTQTDWSGGTASGTVTGTVTTYGSQSDIVTSTAGQLSLGIKSGWYDSNWNYRKSITIDNTQVSGSSDISNFPVLINSTDTDLADTSNGGGVAQADGGDILFTDSSGTKLSHEIESYDNSSGELVAWVKIPTLSYSRDTTIYVYYGNDSGGLDESNTNGVWDSNYQAVWHLSEEQAGTGNVDLYKDSTSNTNHGDDYISSGVQDGQIDGSQSFGSSDYINMGSPSELNITGDITLSSWVRPSSASNHAVITWANSYTNFPFHHTIDTDYIRFNGNNAGNLTSANGVSLNQWNHVVVTVEGTTLRFYINGVADSSNPQTLSTASRTSGNGYLTLSRVGTQQLNAILDEVRVSNIARSEDWIATEYNNQSDPSSFYTVGSQESLYISSATLTSNIFNAEFAADWGELTYTTSGSGTVTVKVRTDSSSDMSGATAWASCSGISSGSDISANGCVTDTDQYLQYQVTLEPSGASTPVFEDISVAFTASDQVAPTTNASNIAMSTASSGGRSVASSGDWNNGATPYFSWTAGEDNSGGNGLKGYCVYLGTDSGGDPATSGGILQNTPVSTSGSTCGFIVSGTSLDLSSASYLSSSLSSGTTYYVNIKAIDQANNIFSGSSATFNFVHDSTDPTNVAYISTPGSNFSNVADMSFSWPTSGTDASSDSNSGVLGYQYQINGTDGTWKGTNTDSTCGLDYIPAATGSYTLTQAEDGSSIEVGSNVVYFRTVDTACNTSTVASYRTGSLSYAGEAPTFETSCGSSSGITVTPSTSTSNSFALSWESATAASGQTVTNYYYMINTSPPSSLSTITSNTSTYIDNDTSTSVSAGKLTGAVKGSNTVYVVAVDDADNYSASNCLKGVFTLNSTKPDPPKNLSVTDASIKSSELWRASLGWDTPDYTGTGSLTYKIERSTDNSTWTEVATTTGTSYIDTLSSSTKYYWRVGSYDTTNESQSDPSYAASVSLTPKGTYTSAASLTSGPTVSGVTTQKATISWTTSRKSDSKVSYGTSSGSYGDVDASSSDQVTSHEIKLSNLSPGTTYYYKAKWTDEDGNTGSSDEKSFTTDPAPTAKDVSVTGVGLEFATINFTVSGASKVKIYYGQTTSFGGVSEISTSTTESTYSINLTGLEDGSKYYYKINTFDEEDDEYEGTVLDFETLPRPRVSNVRIQQVRGAADPTVLVTWESNTEISSIVTYYPEGNPSAAQDEVNVTRREGEHRMLVRGLLANTNYALVVKGRDRLGNEAQSDVQRLTTATDTRPPKIEGLKVEGQVQRESSGQSSAQLVVSWNTDERATSQVDFGEGTGTAYSQRSQEDTNLTFNHTVVLTGLSPSKVYHLRAISKDDAGNEGYSVDTVTITPKAADNALDLVITNLSQAFGFLGNIRQ